MRAERPIPAQALAAIRAPFLEAGATLVDPAVIQPLNLFLDLAGEQMRARLFVVQDEGGREACLRPDFTVPVARMHIDSGDGAGRYLYEGKAFRVAPKGADAALHPEEFGQIGLEIYGGEPAADDAEIVATAWRGAAAGGRRDLAVRFGDVSLFSAFLSAIDVPAVTAARLRRSLARPASLPAVLEDAQAPAPQSGAPLVNPDAASVEALWRERGLEPIGGRNATEVAGRLARKAEAADAPRLSAKQADLIRRLFAIADRPVRAVEQIGALSDGEALSPLLGAWRARAERLKEAGIPEDRMTLSPGFGRFFGYYDGFLFEIGSDSLPADAPIAAGGRYDGLLAQLGGRPGRAVGCIVRPSRAYAGGAA